MYKYTHTHTQRYLQRKVNNTARKKILAEQWSSGIDRVEYERHIGPAMMYRESRFLFLQFWLMRIKCIDAACTTLWPLCNRYLVQFAKFPAEASPRGKESRIFSPPHNNRPRSFSSLYLVIIRIIIPSIRTRSRCFQGKLDPPFGVSVRTNLISTLRWVTVYFVI